MGLGEINADKAWSVWVVIALAGACALGHVIYLIAGSPPSWDLATTAMYSGVLIFSGIACLLRAAVVPTLRGAWIAFGVGLLAWAAGDIYWMAALEDLQEIPYPSAADAGYLATLPCFFVGVALLVRHRVGRFTLASWIDGISASLATAAVGVALLAPALVDATNGDAAAVMTNLAYPLGDLFLFAFVAGAIAVSGMLSAGALLLIGAGMLLWTGADAMYLYLEATNSYTEGWLDTLWTAGALFVALGAGFSVGHIPRRQTSYRSPLWLPALVAGVCVALLVLDHFNRVHEAAVWLAGAALIGVAARLAQSYREGDRLLAALHQETITDGLTGLGNRRRLLADVGHALAHSGRTSVTLAFFDLDGFKTYNDTFGHPAGDALLRRLGSALAESVSEIGSAYRLGGDEFCILVAIEPESAPEVVETARAALSTRGEGFQIGASCGQAQLPAEATSTSDAVRIVDQRMYDEKANRTGRVANQTQELLMRITQEREPGMGEHGNGVARRATELARALAVDAEQLDVIRRAAELHDVGKIAIPDEILNKPSSLDASEWELVRRHTLIGEQILTTAPALRPVAALVRASHERWDGEGYPDGLAGTDIPLGSRIILICDAFDTMTSGRPYRPPISDAEAIEEVYRNAGKQFDPTLARLAASIWARGLAAKPVSI